MNETEIRWTTLTWNPASGCSKVSPGCKYCYAMKLAEQKRGTAAFPVGFDLQLRPHKLSEPLKVKTPSLIFVNSMSDLFLRGITDSYRDQVLDVIEQTPQHQYQVLTKRADNLLRYSRRRKLPENFWAGVTAENQEMIDSRIPILLEVDARVRFVSIEPLLTKIDLSEHIDGKSSDPSGDGLQWVIVGGESGGHLLDESVCSERSIAIRVQGKGWVPNDDRVFWVRGIRDVCRKNRTPLFFKQWGGTRPTSAGHLLDGEALAEFPRLDVPAVTGHRLWS